jgi:hypothetical protein
MLESQAPTRGGAGRSRGQPAGGPGALGPLGVLNNRALAMNAARDMGDPVLIHVWIERADPLAGTAAVAGAEPLGFQGWLELLRVLSGLVVDDR